MENEKPLIFSEIDEDYKKRVKAISKDYLSDKKRKELASSRIKLFSAMVYRLLEEEGNRYDLIVAPGNSGVYMTKICEWIYEYLGLETPKIVHLPIYRFKKDKTFYNNDHLLKKLIADIENIDKLENVLFVDDEIMTGTSAGNILKLLKDAKPKAQRINYTIVAEHHFFEWRHQISNTTVKFYAYARLVWGLNNNIAHIIPKDYYKLVSPFIKEGASYNHTLAVLIGGKFKQKDENDLGFYNTETEDKLRAELGGYDSIKDNVVNTVKKITLEGIEDYKNKKFIFRF